MHQPHGCGPVSWQPGGDRLHLGMAEKLPRHHHALSLGGALVDLGGRGPDDSSHKSVAYRAQGASTARARCADTECLVRRDHEYHKTQKPP
jgi:hypothetical protein